MANVIISNYQLGTPSLYGTSNMDLFSSIWKLTRAMKKAGWTYKASSDGYIMDTSGVAANDRWGGNADPAADVYSTLSASTAITLSSGGSQTFPLATVNVLSTAGFPSSGSFQVLNSSSALQTVTYTGITSTSFTGCSGGTGTISVFTAINVSSNANAWWCAQGPSTLKIPITSASTGTFTRGENITQTTTGAQGELLGYLFDSSVNAGYLVVAPRVDGSGGDPHGWDHAHTITGGLSGATITPSATVIEFVREVVFWKTSNLYQGTVYYQCLDNSAEHSSRFSVIAANASASIAPGGGTGPNAFPSTGTFVVQGTGGANTPANWFQAAPITNTSGQITGFISSAVTIYGKALCIAVSSSYSSGTSADGSFTVAVASPYTTPGSFVGFMFMRVDSQEDGDVDPYTWWSPSNQAVFVPSRTADTSNYPVSQLDFWYVSGYGGGPVIGLTAANNMFKFWRRRGWGGTTDAFQNGTYAFLGASTIPAISNTAQDREKLANAYTDTYVLEDVWCVSYQMYQKTRKGICRWMKAIQGGTSMGMYGNKTWIQLSNMGCNNGGSTPFNWAFVVGPWDGYSTQIYG